MQRCVGSGEFGTWGTCEGGIAPGAESNETATSLYTAQIVIDALAPPPGPALLFGSDRRVSALDAALINGTASHAQGNFPASAAVDGMMTFRPGKFA